MNNQEKLQERIDELNEKFDLFLEVKYMGNDEYKITQSPNVRFYGDFIYCYGFLAGIYTALDRLT